MMQAAKTQSYAQPTMARYAELLAQVFLRGVPVQLTPAGFLQEWDGMTVAAGIAGISAEPASNLTASGVAQQITFVSVPNQPLAVNIPRGAPLNDGKCAVEVSNQDSVFFGELITAGVATIANIGQAYGLTKDAGDNHWYVDVTKVGADAVVRVVDFDRTGSDARAVLFIFLASACQVGA
jgi:hypothetical protein